MENDLICNSKKYILKELKSGHCWLQQQGSGEIFLAAKEGWVDLDQTVVKKILEEEKFKKFEKVESMYINGTEMKRKVKLTRWILEDKK